MADKQVAEELPRYKFFYKREYIETFIDRQEYARNVLNCRLYKRMQQRSASEELVPPRKRKASWTSESSSINADLFKSRKKIMKKYNYQLATKISITTCRDTDFKHIQLTKAVEDFKMEFSKALGRDMDSMNSVTIDDLKVAAFSESNQVAASSESYQTIEFIKYLLSAMEVKFANGKGKQILLRVFKRAFSAVDINITLFTDVPSTDLNFKLTRSFKGRSPSSYQESCEEKLEVTSESDHGNFGTIKADVVVQNFNLPGIPYQTPLAIGEVKSVKTDSIVDEAVAQSFSFGLATRLSQTLVHPVPIVILTPVCWYVSAVPVDETIEEIEMDKFTLFTKECDKLDTDAFFAFFNRFYQFYHQK